MSKTDWTAPHWEQVAAEQVYIAPSIVKRNGHLYVANNPYGGRNRLHHPDTGQPLRTTGDVGAFGPFRVLQLFFRGRWYVIPSYEQLLQWTLGGMSETPDGRDVEPDDRDSWLHLLNLV